MARPRSLIHKAESNLVAELIRECRSKLWDSAFPPNGSVHRVGRYWYYKRYVVAKKGEPAASHREYVGRHSDPAIALRVRRFEKARDAYRERRQIVARLKRLRLPISLEHDARILRALAVAGFFARGTVFIPNDLDLYSVCLGVRIKPDEMRGRSTQAFAFFTGESADVVEGALASLNMGLRRAEFDEAVPELTVFVTAVGDRIGFIHWNARIKSELSRHYKYLCRHAVWSVVLHDDGIAVRVPHPARFLLFRLNQIAQIELLWRQVAQARLYRELLMALRLSRPRAIERVWNEIGRFKLPWKRAIMNLPIEVRDILAERKFKK